MKITILACTLLFFVQSIVTAQTKPIGTQLVLLGTGTPFANPDRSGPDLAKREKRWQDYHATFHTSSSQLAAIANQVQPKLLVLTHQLTFSATLATILAEVQKGYKCAVVNGNDLDVF